MTMALCGRCGEPHDISEIEPSFFRPDPLLKVPAGRRGKDTLESRNACVLFGEPPQPHRYFLRVLCPFSVEHRDAPISWGIWVEVSQKQYERVMELWDDPDQSREPPFPARIANNVWGYEPTLGLAGTMFLQGPESIPQFFLADCSHPFAMEQHAGVSEARVLEWLDPILHRS